MRSGRGANGQRKAASIAMAVGLLALAATHTMGSAAATNTPAATAANMPSAGSSTASPRATSSAKSVEPADDGSAAAVVQQPRPFGYVLADTLTQRILLGPVGQEFQPATLPPAERAGLWFARRSSKIERAEDGRRWLVIDYQLVNAPQTLMTVNLPAVTLKSQTGTVLVVPEWPISVAPLTPRAAFAKGGLQELRPDHAAPMLPTLELRRQLEFWMSAFALTVVVWLGWWLVRSLRAAANQPFASALREIRRTGDDSTTAWLALHRAFDRTAGRVLQTTTLPALFKRAPHFETQRAAIEQFYAQSSLRFFGVAPASGAVATSSVTPSGRSTPSKNGAVATASATPGGRSSPTSGAVGTSGAKPATRSAPAPEIPPRSAATHANGNSAGGSATTISLRTLATLLRRIEKQHER